MRFKIQFPLTSWEPKSDQGILGPVHGIIRKNMMACQSWMVCEFEIETLFLRGSFKGKHDFFDWSEEPIRMFEEFIIDA